MSGLAARWRLEAPGWEPLSRPLFTIALEHLEPLARPGAVVLDLGCGDGLIASLFAAAGASAVGLDISRERVRAGAARHSGAGFLQADAARLPFRDGSLDGLFCSSVLQYTCREAVLAECGRVLKPGARFAVIENLAGNPLARLYRAWKRVSPSGYPLHETPRAHLRRRDLGLYSRYFASVQSRPFHVLAPFFGLLPPVRTGTLPAESASVRRTVDLAHRMDERLIARCRPAKALAWLVVIYGTR